MKHVFILLLCAGILTAGLTGCARKALADGVTSPASSRDSADSGETGETDESASDSESTTAYVVVTDADGQAVTQADGTPVTSVAYGTLPTEVVTVTNAGGQTVTQADGTPVTSVVTPPTVTTKIVQVTDAQGNDVTNDQGEAVTTCEVSPVPATTYPPATDPGKQTDPPQPDPQTTPHSQTTTAANAPTPPPVVTTTTTTTAAPAPTTQPAPKDAWHNPYDLDKIYADCKAEVERQGITWDDSLRPDNSSWSWNISTVIYSYHPDKYSLKDDVFEGITSEREHYGETQWPMKTCRVWFEPYKDGDYHVYILYTE